jgi:predicted glycosyltransferase
MAITLQQNGEELIDSQNIEHNDSLRPKCDELARMVDVLSSALEYRTRVIDLSKIMHQQINEVIFLLKCAPYIRHNIRIIGNYRIYSNRAKCFNRSTCSNRATSPMVG